MAAATITGGVTPVYAAPETLRRLAQRFSDQYSLAIVYQELLTGQRPSRGRRCGSSSWHLQEEPNLSGFQRKSADHAGALLEESDQRFPTCVEMVTAARRYFQGTSVLVPPPHASLAAGRYADLFERLWRPTAKSRR
ncbi:MAG: hypothetical protein U0744_00315 [Gemmataceae bacterium]